MRQGSENYRKYTLNDAGIQLSIGIKKRNSVQDRNSKQIPEALPFIP